MNISVQLKDDKGQTLTISQSEGNRITIEADNPDNQFTFVRLETDKQHLHDFIKQLLYYIGYDQ